MLATQKPIAVNSHPRPIIAVKTQPNNSVSNTTNQLFEGLKTPEGLMMVGCVLLYALVSFSEKGGGRGKKNRLAKGRLGTQKEKVVAQRTALKQMGARLHNEVAFYLGRPSQNKNSILFIPEAQRGVAVGGGPGSGKTDSAILPMIFSALDQDLPCIVYDFKYPTLTKRFVGHAAKRGYNVKIFAPGYRESGVCNILGFLEPDDEGTDSLMAGQLAETLNRNFKKASQQKGDDAFFSTAGDQLVQAILMLARRTAHPDLMMCQAILSLTDLPKRLMASREKINTWVYANFGMMMASAQSEKTVAGIVATANRLFTTFMKAKVLSAFCGKTTIPIELKGKQVLVFGLDRSTRDVLAPLIATLLDLIVTRNVTCSRQDPLCLFLDEVPTLYLPRLVNWLNENREDGLCTVLGFQNIVQLEQTYGKEVARAILGGCATKILFNPQDYESAKLFSDYLDDEEVHYKQRSRSYGSHNGSTSVSDQERTKRLMSPGEILKLPKGKCILINPGYESNGEAYVPIVEKVKLTLAYTALKTKSTFLWGGIRKKLERRSRQNPVTQSDLRSRYDLADSLYRLSTGNQNQSDNSAYRVTLPNQKIGLDVEKIKRLAGF
ncbi:MAG: type IV secretory system conjugative DNA transfer family protein [Hydrococcus sp. CRU_1_1]|nr:type IV secretory system conjugative DNA transfer family protein [Hydrococcus sp. CRU_1_1]